MKHAAGSVVALALIAAGLLFACHPSPTKPSSPPELDALDAAGIRARTASVDAARVASADGEPQNWLVHGRSNDEQRFSPLARINDANASRLGLAWSFETNAERGHEATPIVVDGVMFVTAPWSVVHALDARTGELLWTHDPQVPRAWARRACCDVVNRGAAVWKGRVYVGTLDGRLVALDAGTGDVVFDVNTIDREQPYTITGAPRVVKGKVVIGNGGAEYGVRGYVSAYDAEDGELVWRFYTVPGNPALGFEHPELEAAAATWNGEWWKLGGGGTVWDSLAYDADLDLLYVGVGNGSPWSRTLRSPGGGDNLFLSSILALRPDTGELVWHYQTTPADNWDYTAVQHMILADLPWQDGTRKVLMQAPKNGFFYVLDRATGELLSAEKFVRVSWASHVDAVTGRPVENPEGDYDETPRVILPSPNGGHLWHPMSYSPKTGLVYIPALEIPFLYLKDPAFEPVKNAWNLGLDLDDYNRVLEATEFPPAWGELKAWDPIAQKAVWTVRHPGAFNGGVLSTAGNLVFQGTADGRFVAYAADTGSKLWEVLVRVGIVAPPVTYEVDGVQYVSVLAGWGGGGTIEGMDIGFSAAGQWENKGRLLTFALGGEAEVPVPAALTHRVAEELPDLGASDAEIARGEALFNRYCMPCHGVLAMTSGVVPDLRYASEEVHASFQDIVLGGVRVHRGMASFADLLSIDDVRLVQAYVVQRAIETREEVAETAAEGPPR
jgi:PQQ-dependent dehydrogenase (methanol/ethanol family)